MAAPYCCDSSVIANRRRLPRHWNVHVLETKIGCVLINAQIVCVAVSAIGEIDNALHTVGLELLKMALL